MGKILIKNAEVYDGLGNDSYKADVLVDGEKIAEISNGICENDCKVIDANGKILCPGFVDIHRHCDAKVLTDKDFGEIELLQGVTTTVVGNCGISLIPTGENSREFYDLHQAVMGKITEKMPKTMAEYKIEVEKNKTPLNVGTMVGMGAVRFMVKGALATQLLQRRNLRLREILSTRRLKKVRWVHRSGLCIYPNVTVV